MVVDAARREGELANERDFYRRLLDLGAQPEIEPLLDQAMALIVEVTGATTAYVELYDDDDGAAPRFWRGHQCTDADVDSIRTSISRGIIGRALSEGRTIETPSALQDARFSSLRSVRQNDIQAVLCAPIDVPPSGVLYLQGRTRPGMFSAFDRERAELFARQLAPLVDRLVRRGQPERIDYTREFRARLVATEMVIGRSRVIAQLLQRLEHLAHLEVDVLITGAAGTGKAEIARALHANSPRAAAPFIEVTCGTTPDNVLEAELFGTDGTGGKLAAAEGGTLFLDEVAELSLATQIKLLRLSETREYLPIGSATSVRANLRIATATNANLEERVAAKQSREDLFYRLHVVPLEVPPLNERRDDIPELVDHFCREACARHGCRRSRCRGARRSHVAKPRGRVTADSSGTPSRRP